MSELLVGRQPIFNRSMEVYAYELLYRSDQNNQAVFNDGDQATMQVILNSLVEIGLENIVGDSWAFINLTRNFLLGKYPIPLPANRVVLEVLEDVKSDCELVKAVGDLRNAGFMIALDDVSDLNRINPFCDFSPIIKLDLMQIDPFVLPEIAAGVKARGLRLL
ncbi:MAG: putative signal transduction protein containing EAL and modified HD-GYP domain, partial [Chloroflexi bacterium]